MLAQPSPRSAELKALIQWFYIFCTVFERMFEGCCKPYLSRGNNIGAHQGRVNLQKSCRNEGCQRKFDKTFHSDLCPPCSNAFRSRETQTHKRAEHQQRQQNARAQALSVNCNIPPTFANSPPQPTTTQGFQGTASSSTSLPLVSQPMAPLRQSQAAAFLYHHHLLKISSVSPSLASQPDPYLILTWTDCLTLLTQWSQVQIVLTLTQLFATCMAWCYTCLAKVQKMSESRQQLISVWPGLMLLRQ